MWWRRSLAGLPDSRGKLINQVSPSVRGLFYSGSFASTGAPSMKRRRGCRDGMAAAMAARDD